MQSGLITEADGGIVTIKPLPGQASYTGSTANGVTSSSLGPWPGSFQLVASGTHGGSPALSYGGGSWTSSAVSYRGQNGSEYLYICPGGGLLGTVYGTNTYTDDSSVCTAAVQVGLITAKDGGRVTIVIKPGQSSYPSFTAHGVTTRSYPSAAGSFSFAGAAPIPGSPGGGPSTTTTTAPAGRCRPRPQRRRARYSSTARPSRAERSRTARPWTSLTAPPPESGHGQRQAPGAGGVTAAFVAARDRRQEARRRVPARQGRFGACPKRKKNSAGARGREGRPAALGERQGKVPDPRPVAAATVRGTHWLTADRCDGTLTKVVRGVVQVADLPKHKTVSVPAGHSYLAKP